MNRRLLVIVAVAAVLALLAGAAVGRNLLSSATTPAASADIVRFKDEVSKVSVAYPGGWKRLARPDDPDLALLVGADTSTLMSMRVTAVGLAEVTPQTLPIVRKFTDSLVAEDPRAKLLREPETVDLGGLPGLRYRYTFGSGDTGGAHDHYFLFKDALMIQIVFQVTPASRLPKLAPEFDRIASSFEGNDK